MYKNSDWGEIITICSQSFVPFRNTPQHFPAPSLTSCLSLTCRGSAGANWIFRAGVVASSFESESNLLFSKPLVRLPRPLLWSVFAEMSRIKGEKQKAANYKSQTRRLKARGCLAFSPLIEPDFFFLMNPSNRSWFVGKVWCYCYF